jgi:hypothetical protein
MTMRRLRLAPAVPALLAALALAPSIRAQQEPPIVPAATPAPAGTPAPAPTPARSEVPMAPLSSSLDFARWREMSSRERQTFVEGAVLALGSVTSRLRAELPLDSRTPPGLLAAVVKFVDANYPKRPALAYQKEMESIYLTPEGQKLPMLDCFLQAFRRINAR